MPIKRYSYQEDNLKRIRLIQIPSFKKFLNKRYVDKFIIITTNKEYESVKRSFRNEKHYPFQIINENVVCPKLKNYKGWYKQQVLKLAVAKLVKTKFYLVVDADVFCTKPMTYNSLIVNKKPIFNLKHYNNPALIGTG